MNCRTLPSWKYFLCTIPLLEALRPLPFGPTTLSLPTLDSWGFMVCRQLRQIGLCLQKVRTIMMQTISCPLFPNPEHHRNVVRKLAFETQNKTLHLFWVLPLCWSWAWLHNSLLKPFCSNICRELCKVISAHCQASLSFALALTPSVKIRHCFTAWVNPYRCPYLWGTKTQL